MALIQGPHQVAQKSSRTTCPSSRVPSKVLPFRSRASKLLQDGSAPDTTPPERRKRTTASTIQNGYPVFRFLDIFRSRIESFLSWIETRPALAVNHLVDCSLRRSAVPEGSTTCSGSNHAASTRSPRKWLQDQSLTRLREAYSTWQRGDSLVVERKLGSKYGRAATPELPLTQRFVISVPARIS